MAYKLVMDSATEASLELLPSTKSRELWNSTEVQKILREELKELTNGDK